MAEARTYDDVVDWYAGWVGGVPDELFYASLQPLLGDVSGLAVCDLGCGVGRIARSLASRGARVVGIDTSKKLLRIAQDRERSEPLGISYRLDDARVLETISDASLGGVVSNMAMMDIADLDPALRSVARVLQPGGWFAFSILHPCFHTPSSSEVAVDNGAVHRTVGGYWDEGFWRSDQRVGPPGRIGAYHRTLSTYVNALTASGLRIERAVEPRVQGALAERRPVWTEVPAVIGMRCVREYGNGGIQA